MGPWPASQSTPDRPEGGGVQMLSHPREQKSARNHWELQMWGEECEARGWHSQLEHGKWGDVFTGHEEAK